MILLVLILFGCNQIPVDPITEIGNPEMTIRARTASSLHEWVATEATALQHIEQVWVSIAATTLLNADCAPMPDSTSAGAVLNWVDDVSVVVMPEVNETSCGASLSLDIANTLPDNAPEALRGASVLLIGLDPLDRPFEIRSTVPHTATLVRVLDDGRSVFADDAQLAIDLTVLTAGINLAALAASPDGIVRVQDNSSVFNANIADAFRISVDYLDDGRLDLYDILGSTAASGPSLADEDRDRLPDINERLIHVTDPQDIDSDDDGLGDAEEVLQYGTNPNATDTDQDGVSDGYEIYNGTDPLDPDSV